MRRVSASDDRVRRPVLVRSVTAAALAAAATLGLSAFASSTADDDGGGGGGRLELDTSVLVNESGGVGATGDFAVRGRLFSAALSAKAQAQREAAAERVEAARTRDFAERGGGGENYRSVRATLFAGYAPSTNLQVSRPEGERPTALYAAGAAAAVPLVLAAGVLLARSWVKRRRRTS